jgi:hypothetical protein
MCKVQMLAELEEVVEYKLAPERRSTIRDMWWKRLQVLYYLPIPQVSASDPSPFFLHTQSYESCFMFFDNRGKGLFGFPGPGSINLSIVSMKDPDPQHLPVYLTIVIQEIFLQKIFFPRPFWLSWTRVHQSKYCKCEFVPKHLLVYLTIVIQEIFPKQKSWLFGCVFGFPGPGSIHIHHS